MKAAATFKFTRWDEKPYHESSESMRMTHASVDFVMNGALEGKATLEYLMFYRRFDAKAPLQSSASYVGLLRFEGILDGKEGSFVLEDRGTFEGGTAKSGLQVIPGSGTGALKGISGQGTYQASHTSSSFELDYELA